MRVNVHAPGHESMVIGKTAVSLVQTRVYVGISSSLFASEQPSGVTFEPVCMSVFP